MKGAPEQQILRNDYATRRLGPPKGISTEKWSFYVPALKRSAHMQHLKR